MISRMKFFASACSVWGVLEAVGVFGLVDMAISPQQGEARALYAIWRRLCERENKRTRKSLESEGKARGARQKNSAGNFFFWGTVSRRGRRLEGAARAVMVRSPGRPWDSAVDLSARDFEARPISGFGAAGVQFNRIGEKAMKPANEKQDKQMDKNGADEFLEAPRISVDVVIRWGAGVICLEYLSPPRTFYIGDATAGQVDCVIPAEAIGYRKVPLVWVDGSGNIYLVVLPKATGVLTRENAGEEKKLHDEIGSQVEARELDGLPVVPLALGTKAHIELGGFDIEVNVGHAGRAVAGHYFFDKRALPYHAFSAALHVGAMVLCATAIPSLSEVPDSDEISADQVYLMQHYLMASAEAESEEEAFEEDKAIKQSAASNRSHENGGAGTRAKGEEGSMGSPAASKSSKYQTRYGVSGAQDKNRLPSEPPQAFQQEATEFGMIGLLNSGSGGDPNAPTAPWGQDSAAYGMVPGSQGSAGGGGLGLSGIGHGGGGRQGISGTGSIGTIGHGSGGGAGQAFGQGRGIKPPMPRFGSAFTGNGTGPLPSVETDDSSAEAPIDPNGRFATTYRPGGGHLSAFESAVSRGIVPGSERELVSDIGARYTPALNVPAGKSLAFQADVERPKMAPEGGAYHVRLSLSGSGEKPAERPHLSVHLVLDVSGSMGGEPLQKAKEAAEKLVNQLAPSDDFSLVTFSDEAKVRVPDGLVGARREAIKAVIRSLEEEGGTNIHDGMLAGYGQASQASIPDDAVRVVLLLSDGRATSGITNSAVMSRLALNAFQNGIQTSTLGLGTDYDGEQMSSIASDGAGGYYYLQDGDQIASALTMELSKRLDPVATAVELRVRLKKDVDLLRVYGSRRLNEAESAAVRAQEVAADVQAAQRDGIARDRKDNREGGMRFFIPAFARGDSHSILLKLKMPPGVDARSIASIELKYKDRIAKKNVVEELALNIDYAGSDGESAASADPGVLRTVQGFAAGETLSAAAARIAAGDRESAVAMLSERETILKSAAEQLKEPLFVRDAQRLSRLRAFAGSSAGLGDPLVLSMMMETMGRVHMH